jgi:hypothetical protein
MSETVNLSFGEMSLYELERKVVVSEKRQSWVARPAIGVQCICNMQIIQIRGDEHL